MVAPPSSRVNWTAKVLEKVTSNSVVGDYQPNRHGAFPNRMRLTYDHLHRPRVARIGIWTEPGQRLEFIPLFRCWCVELSLRSYSAVVSQSNFERRAALVSKQSDFSSRLRRRRATRL